MILTPFWAIVDVEELAAISAVVGSIGALILVIASFAFLKKAPKNNDASNHEMPDYKTQNLYAARQTACRRSKHNLFKIMFRPQIPGKRRDTGDLVQPGSVTESTTRLLRKEE
jgi:hypothetical protein